MELSATDYLGLVKALATRIYKKLPRDMEYDDIRSAGYIGLMDALKKFDSKKGVSFTSYARYRIRGAIFDYLRSLDFYPRELRRRAKKERTELKDMPPLLSLDVNAYEEDGATSFVNTLPNLANTAAKVEAIAEASWILAKTCTSNSTILNLYYLKGLTLKEIGRRLGKSESWVCLRRADIIKNNRKKKEQN